MKLTISALEAKQIIRTSFCMLADADISIEGMADSSKIIGLIEIMRMGYKDREKISAIKKFREISGCDLGSAKYAVEHFDRVLQIVLETGRLPEFSGTYPSIEMK